MYALLAFYAFAIGAVVGSFLNVVIHRYPREQSIVFPGSHCPHCNAAIRWFDNIPLLSWLILLGRCRRCRGPIALRYPLVELANGLFYLAVFLRTGATVPFLFVASLVSMTIVLIYIDAEIQILPDVIDLPGVALGLLMGALHFGALDLRMKLTSTFMESLIGAAVGGGILLAVALGYKLVRGVDGMGLGDVKMMAMIGAVSGWQAVLAVLLLAAVSGALVGVIIMAVQRRTDLKFALPFGVFLGLAFLAVLFFGTEHLTWLPTLAPMD
jgi:leader peptidase (prepilin peptidase)/N-methyltransferase